MMSFVNLCFTYTFRHFPFTERWLSFAVMRRPTSRVRLFAFCVVLFRMFAGHCVRR